MLRRTFGRFGTEQILKDMPISTTRKPTGLHRGPHRRKVSEPEKNEWMFMRKLNLQALDEWSGSDQFKHLPKAKKLYGNEAAEIVWPYAVLQQNVIRVHPFTKSLYLYYFQHPLSAQGRARNALARVFARECMIPITFHNSQCYVESEMLLEYGDVPYVVVNTLDERSKVVPIVGKDKEAIIRDVITVTDEMGSSAKNAEQLWQTYNDRPNQNGFIKIDYQWMGSTMDERQQHLVKFDWDWDDVEPTARNRTKRIHELLNNSDNMPFDIHAYKKKSVYRRAGTGSTSRHNVGAFEGVHLRQQSNTGYAGPARPY